MRNLIKNSTLLRICLPLIFLVGIHEYCKRHNGDFEIRQIFSDWENREEWVTDEQPIQPLLSQNFRFLGGGGQCYAFLGEDQTTVLKFFKHYDAQGRCPLEHIFNSSKIAYDELREETGLLYLHLNKTEPFYVSLIDPLGFAHWVNVNATEYAVQQKADSLLLDTFDQLLEKGNLEEIRAAIYSFIQLIAKFASKGIGDRDNAVHRNYAYFHHQATAIDIGSYFRDEQLKTPLRKREEVIYKTRRLFEWLRKYKPELVPYYEHCLQAIN